MRLGEGKTYRDAKGRKVGPMSTWDHCGSEHPWSWNKSDGAPGQDLIYRDDGTSDYNPDLIAEWTDGPVRTVTCREVVKGVHSGVLVMGATDTHVAIAIHDPTTPNREYYAHGLTSIELKAAAAVLLELAGALDSE